MKKANETIVWDGLENDFPQEIKEIPQWRLWRYVPVGKEWKKRPADASGNIKDIGPADALGPFKAICEPAKKRDVLGIGFYLGEKRTGPGLVCVDLDHVGGNLETVAAFLLQQVGEDTYIEYSPSGNGLHIWMKTDHLELIRGSHPNHPRFLLNEEVIYSEVYGWGRFLSVTGNTYKQAPLCSGAAGDRFLNWLYEQDKSLDTQAGRKKWYVLPFAVNAMVNDETIQEALETISPVDLEAPGLADLTIVSELNKYLEGRTFADESQSPIDQAAMDFLAVETDGSPADMLRLFYQAGRARDKWTEPKHFGHYAIPTMHKAIGLYYLQTGKGLTEEYITGLPREDLLDTDLVQRILAIKSKDLREYVRELVENRAGVLRCKNNFKRIYLEETKKREQEAQEGRVTRFPEQPKALLCGEYFCDGAGVRRMRETGGTEKLEVVSPIPIMPVDLYVNVADGSEKVELAYYKGGQWKRIIVPRSVLANKNKIVNLAGMGPEVTTTTATGLVNYLADMISRNLDNGKDPEHTLQRRASISQFGWTAGGEFAPYSEKIQLDIGEQERQLVEAVQPKGELKEWLSTVAPLLPSLPVRMAIAASLASPIVGYLNALPFVFHVWGPTGVGKSVLLKVAASVWGNPADGGGLVDSLNNTVNYIMGKAAVLNNLPFFGDELQTIKADDYDKLIYRLSEGISRGRMRPDGSRAPQQHWHNVSLFTGEEPVTQSSSGGGAENRTVEMEITSPVLDPLQVGPLLDSINGCYGVLGPVFVQRLKDQKAAVKAGIRIFQNELIAEPYGATAKQALSLSTMLTAYNLQFCEIAKQEGVKVPEISLDELQPVIKTAKEVDTADKAYQYTADRIKMSRNNFYISERVLLAADKYGVSHIPRGEYWGRIDLGKGGNWEVAIYKTSLERILADQGFKLKAVQSAWVKRGYIEKKYTSSSYSGSVNGKRGTMLTLILPGEKGSRKGQAPETVDL